jgi:hypothetical protein
MSATPRLEDWIRDIKSLDATTFEDTYEGPRPVGDDVIPRLISEMHAAQDSYTRGKSIELLGEMGDASVVPQITAELDHPEQPIRDWAVAALQLIGGDAANEAIAQYESSKSRDSSNHAMERTADRYVITFEMTSTHSPPATRAPRPHRYAKRCRQVVRRRSSFSLDLIRFPISHI